MDKIRKMISVILLAMTLLAVGVAVTEGSSADGGIPKPDEYMYVITLDDDNGIANVYASKNHSDFQAVTNETGDISEYWSFDHNTGMGPFNSFYAAINIDDNPDEDNGEELLNTAAGTVAFVLDPYDLSKTVRGTKFTVNKYNVMLVVPAVYWKTDDNDDRILYMSNSPSYKAGTTDVSGMVAYAHTAISEGVETVYPYIGLGVYEASILSDKLASVSGAEPQSELEHSDFKEFADSLIPAAESDYQLWNFYQWTLYKMMAYTVLGSKDAQVILGDGPVDNDSASETGLSNNAGPYAASSAYSKLFLENTWGSLSEFVGETIFSDRKLCAGNNLGGSIGPQEQIQGAVLPYGGMITDAYTASEYWDLPMYSDDEFYPGAEGWRGDGVRSSEGLTVLTVGGNSNSKSEAGLACTFASNGIGENSSSVGARLAYVMTDSAVSKPYCEVKTVFTDASGHETVETFSVPYGTELSTSLDGYTLYVGDITVRADVPEDTAQYHYEFSDWDFDSYRVEGDIVISSYVTASLRSYNVVWCKPVGDIPLWQVLLQKTLAYGEQIIYDGQTPTMDGDAQYSYVFTGWDPELPQGTTVTGNATYYAVFEEVVNKYVITFLDGDGNVIQDDEFEYGQIPSYSGETPTKSPDGQHAYVFAETWDPEIESVTGIATYTAQFNETVRLCEVKTVFTDASGHETVETFSVPYGTELSTSLDGYTLYVGDITVRADVPEDTAQYHYEFSDWDFDSYRVEGDIVISSYVTASLRSYNVVWCKPVGDIPLWQVLLQKTLAYGEQIIYDGQTPTMDGDAQYSYVFTGWDPELPQGTTVTGNATYYAVFEEVVNKYVITFLDGDGNVIQDDEFEYGQIPSYSGETPTKSPDGQHAYVFAETWDPEIESVTGTATYTAQFNETARLCDVTIQAGENGSVTLGSVTVPYGTAISAEGSVLTVGEQTSEAVANESTKEYDYAFAGWDIPSPIVTGDMRVVADFTVTLKGFEYGSVWYDYVSEGVVSASGIVGEPAVVKIPAAVEFDGMSFEPLYIADNAFAGCMTVTSITIGEKVAVIGEGALDSPYLAEINVDSGSMVFESDAGVLYDKGMHTLLKFPASKQRLVIPETVAEIADGAFRNAGVSLKEDCADGDPITYFRYVSIPSTVESVGNEAFAGSTLEVLKIGSGSVGIGSRAFSGCGALNYVVFYGTLGTVAGDAFEGCIFHGEDGAEMEFDASEMASHKFTGSDSQDLRMYVPKAGGTIAYEGVKYRISCSSGAKTVFAVAIADADADSISIPVTIPYLGFDWTVTSVGSKAFMGNSRLASVACAVDVGFKSFAKCSGLEYINLDGASSVGSYAFYGCSKLLAADLGSVKALGTSAFSGCASLADADLSGVGSVGKHAFYGCSLTKANLSSATKIGYGAFTGNDLREVTFGGGLESVDPKAFFRYSFWDAGDNRIPVSAQDLAGMEFIGTGKKLHSIN